MAARSVLGRQMASMLPWRTSNPADLGVAMPWRSRSFSSTTNLGQKWDTAVKALMARWKAENLGSSPRTAMAAKDSLVHDEYSLKLPHVFVKPPFYKFPRRPRAFFDFVYTWLWVRFTDVRGYLAFSLSSKPSFFKRALFRRDRKAIVMTAKALHRDMCEALAAGDQHTLARVCQVGWASRMGAVVESRPRGRRYVWELVRYNGQARIRDAKIALMDSQSAVFSHQVVVSIASRQRLVQYDDTGGGGGRPVPGTEKEVDLVEHLVLATFVDAKTYTQEDWRIISTVKETTPEAFAEEKKLVEAANQEEHAKSGRGKI